jgi:hypothetical protein
MNLDDLKHTLTEMAEDVRGHEPAVRLTGVNDKLNAARRRRATGAGIGVAAVVAVLSLVLPDVFSESPNRSPSPAGRTTTSAPTPNHQRTHTSGGIVDTLLPTVVDKGVVFYRSPAGDALIGEAVGTPGQTSLALTVTPTTRDLAFVEFCWRRPQGGAAVNINATFNAKQAFGSSCDSDRRGPLGPEITFGSDPRVNARGWGNLGVDPGEAMTVRLAVPPRSRQLARTDQVQLGLAVYANTGPTVVDHGMTIPTQAVFDGHSYELVDRAVKNFNGFHGRIDLRLPPAGSRRFAEAGVRSVHGPYVEVGPGGIRGGSSRGGGASEVGSPLGPGQRVARAAVHSRKDPSGQLYLLIYQQTS